jgi:hypothetical protein
METSGHRRTDLDIDAWSCGVAEGLRRRIQDSVGSRQKLSVARKRVISRADPAVRKGNIRKGPGRNSVERVHPKSRALGKKQRLRSEYKRINCRDSRQQLRLRMKRTSDNWSARCKRLDILEGPATAQAQEECADSVGTGIIETLANLVLKKKQ